MCSSVCVLGGVSFKGVKHTCISLVERRWKIDVLFLVETVQQTTDFTHKDELVERDLTVFAQSLCVCVRACVCVFSPPAGFFPLRAKRKTKNLICMFSFQSLKELREGGKKGKCPQSHVFSLCSFSHQPVDHTHTHTR